MVFLMPFTQDLWPAGHLNLLGTADRDVPTLTVFPVTAQNAPCVVVLPGGGYQALADHEADPIALWLNTLGIASVVARYRRAPHKHPTPFDDGCRAIRTVRARASEWNIDPGHVGVLGFSAGGHLAATVATQGEAPHPKPTDAIDTHSARPDVAVLAYPVITLQSPFAHVGSRINLLGEGATPADIAHHSVHTRVTPRTCPTFLFHTVDDEAVPVENSLLFADALRRNNVAFEMHLYEHGYHGVGLATGDPILKSWPERCADWLARHGLTGRVDAT